MAAMTSAQQKQLPKDAQVITSILKEAGITEYEPRVINQLLEFTYRYVAGVLEDAKVYANHAKKKMLDLDDVRLAVHLQLDRSFTTPPPRDILLEIARMKNNSPLPLVKPHCGIRLPPDRYCLNSCNYRLKSTIPKKFNHSAVSSGSYSMQQQGGVKMGVKAPQIHVVKRPSNASLTTVPRTQSISTPKPVIRFSPAGMHQTQTMMTPKPKIQIATAGSQQIEMAVKFETDEDNSLKRKREPDDYDSLDH
ncbi:transcription initiation factor TFIID subunit 9 [Macrosteles quadrilineatus]|uniref:transcription initiation factor TFIID subunit 9 n=1 Tax=Macrosteles quadrilineatus TaxID=74068 RepID=UPI0023E18AD8|nr:transcription initiation factor TFIID subunit 9 [Macrosteles quadrilineatus]